MFFHENVAIVSGEAAVRRLPEAVYQWPGRFGEDRGLVFREAYEIRSIPWDGRIENCTFQVCRRRFRDLSFLDGKTLRKFPEDYELREHDDGTRFLFSYVSIPTFDSEDRVWDSMEHTAVYDSPEGVQLIHCRHGYRIPRIEVYVGLIRPVPVFTQWLEILGCADRYAPAADGERG